MKECRKFYTLLLTFYKKSSRIENDFQIEVYKNDKLYNRTEKKYYGLSN